MLLTKKELLAKLMEAKGAKPITIVSKTTPKLLKKHRDSGEPCPYSNVSKVSRTNGMMNFDYEKAVNRQLVREGKEDNFEAVERKWGKHITRGIIEHKGKYYLQLKVQNAIESVYLQNDERVEIDKGYLPKQSTKQGVKKEVIVRDYSLDNISSIKIGGESYDIV